MKKFVFAICALLLAGAPSAFAAPVSFVLGDHPDGALYNGTDNPYGLRYDDTDSIYSVGDNLAGSVGGPVILTFDPMNLAAGATISGTVVDVDDSSVWTLVYTLSGLTAAPNGGFIAQKGEGTMTDGSDVIVLTGKSDGTGVFIFDDDGHRLPGDTGWVGRGWLKGDGTNDFLVTATVVPVPAALWLFAPALLGLAGLRRRSAT